MVRYGMANHGTARSYVKSRIVGLCFSNRGIASQTEITVLAKVALPLLGLWRTDFGNWDKKP